MTLSTVRPAVRVGGFSAVLRIGALLTVFAMIAVLFGLFALDIAVGEFRIPVGKVLDVLGGGGTRAQRFVIMDSRLPRALTAVVVGAALGLAGAVTQSILRNPLASPDLLGITPGASCGAVAVLVGMGGVATGTGAVLGLSAAALLGGLLTAVLIYLLAWGRTATGDGGVMGFRLVLIGIGVNAALLSVVNWLLTRATLTDAAHAQQWLTGSLNAADWSTLIPASIGLGLALLVTAGSARTLATLRFGTDTTRILGVRIQTQQAILIAAAVSCAALATAAVGPMGFVGLAAPQIARRLLRTAGEPLIASALVGAIAVVGADLLARTAFPVSLPVGVVTAAVGGPFLLYLLVRTNRKATP
ncbi:iron chelate uptake ABC transporter family permease subunit [Nocardia sp. CDC153]|uniref:FecCD family ABC transporter permease n=1 Tax=Nocardia sp. CDC153 TaxID=3112167 RepID=UPI002DB7DD63|nr:iron chelate uptake ABC transporter family permease subunit [Nocardia sp. CDC153]MEC3956002.1 iron chelate uptake ABC transporter family permease subunit [Nocardia sp. CDC153]